MHRDSRPHFVAPVENSQQIASVVRNHWAIESQQYWVCSLMRAVIAVVKMIIHHNNSNHKRNLKLKAAYGCLQRQLPFTTHHGRSTYVARLPCVIMNN